MKGKGRGWKGESQRHRMSAYGIKTNFNPSQEKNLKRLLRNHELGNLKAHDYKGMADLINSNIEFTMSYEELAEEEINKESNLAYDIADEFGQIFGNIKHTGWFKKAVAEALEEQDIADNKFLASGISISEMKEINKHKGKYYFSKDTMRFFNSIIHTKGNLIKDKYFVESIQDTHTGADRQYRVHQFDIDTGKVTKLEEFSILSEANDYARSL